MTAVAKLHRTAIIESVRDGLYLDQIAQRYNVTSGAISQILADDPEYKSARLAATRVRIDRAHKMVEDVAGNEEATGADLNLARVREIYARRVEFRAGLEFPDVFQPKTANVNINVFLADKLRQAERVIEHEPDIAATAHIAAQQDDGDVSD